MYDTKSAIAVAGSQAGYHEGYSGGHWNNLQKFSTLLPNFAWSQGQAWCAVFVQFVLWFVGVRVPPGAQSASCATSVAAYKKAGRWTSYPVIGAQVFYGPGGGTHTGIVTGYDSTYMTAIEGNTNTNGSPEGDGVYPRTHERRAEYVYGYGVPYYQGLGVSPDPKWNGRDLSK